MGSGPAEADASRMQMRERDRRNSNMRERTFALRDAGSEASRPTERQDLTGIRTTN
ncbi:MAG: hypothetical protein WKF84_00975 [Pyrinomonadaceae bacterium]